MDTISRENNNMLPIGGIIVGVVGLMLGAYSLVLVNKVKNQLADDQPKIEKIDEIATQAGSAASTATATRAQLDKSLNDIQGAFTQVGNSIGAINTQLTNLEKAEEAPAGKKGKGGAVEVVAGPGEYIVKAHDTSSKIAAANGCTRAQLLAVNPGVNWAKLHPGQKLKLPEKKPAA